MTAHQSGQATCWGHVGANLLVDHDLLNPLQELLGFGQAQPERVHRQGIPLDLPHLVYHRWPPIISIIRLDNHLHADPHAAVPSALIPTCASWQLAARRSKRSIFTQQSRATSCS